MGAPVEEFPDATWDEPRFQRWLVAYARANGWTVRVMDQRGRPGWKGQQTDKGWPDLLLIKDRAVWLELKRVGGKLRADQEVIIGKLVAAGQEVHVVEPTAWEQVLTWIL